MLFDASRTQIEAPKTCGGNLSPLYTPLEIKELLENAFMTLYPNAFLLRIHPVALLKVETMRLSTANFFVLGHFEHLVWKVPVIVSIGKQKHSETFGEMIVMVENIDLWAWKSSLTTLMNAVNGICGAIDLMLHPTILWAERVQDMFLNLLKTYSKNNGKTYPKHMADVFEIRMQQKK